MTLPCLLFGTTPLRTIWELRQNWSICKSYGHDDHCSTKAVAHHCGRLHNRTIIGGSWWNIPIAQNQPLKFIAL